MQIWKKRITHETVRAPNVVRARLITLWWPKCRCKASCIVFNCPLISSVSISLSSSSIMSSFSILSLFSPFLTVSLLTTYKCASYYGDSRICDVIKVRRHGYVSVDYLFPSAKLTYNEGIIKDNIWHLHSLSTHRFFVDI